MMKNAIALLGVLMLGALVALPTLGQGIYRFQRVNPDAPWTGHIYNAQGILRDIVGDDDVIVTAEVMRPVNAVVHRYGLQYYYMNWAPKVGGQRYAVPLGVEAEVNAFLPDAGWIYFTDRFDRKVEAFDETTLRVGLVSDNMVLFPWWPKTRVIVGGGISWLLTRPVNLDPRRRSGNILKPDLFYLKGYWDHNISYRYRSKHYRQDVTLVNVRLGVYSELIKRYKPKPHRDDFDVGDVSYREWNFYEAQGDVLGHVHGFYLDRLLGVENVFNFLTLQGGIGGRIAWQGNTLTEIRVPLGLGAYLLPNWAVYAEKRWYIYRYISGNDGEDWRWWRPTYRGDGTLFYPDDSWAFYTTIFF